MKEIDLKGRSKLIVTLSMVGALNTSIFCASSRDISEC